MNNLLKCVDHNHTLEHNVSLTTSIKNNLTTHSTIHQSINELVHIISVYVFAPFIIKIPLIQSTKCSTENKEGISFSD